MIHRITVSVDVTVEVDDKGWDGVANYNPEFAAKDWVKEVLVNSLFATEPATHTGDSFHQIPPRITGVFTKGTDEIEGFAVMPRGE